MNSRNSSLYSQVQVAPGIVLQVHQNLLARQALSQSDQMMIAAYAAQEGWPLDQTYVLLHVGHTHGRPSYFVKIACGNLAVSLEQIRNGSAFALVDRQRRMISAQLPEINTDRVEADKVIAAVTTVQSSPLITPPTHQPSVLPLSQSQLKLHRHRVNSGSTIAVMVLLFTVVVGLISWALYDVNRKPVSTHPTSGTATIVATHQAVSTPTLVPSTQLKTTDVPAKLVPYSGHWIVAENQSLSAIADALGGEQNYDEIATTNNILNPNVINVGQDLLVLLGYRQVLKGVQGRSYVVVNGDSVWVTSSMVITGAPPAAPIYHRPDYEGQATQLRGDISHIASVGYRVYQIDHVVKQYECTLKGVAVVITTENAADMLKLCGAG